MKLRVLDKAFLGVCASIVLFCSTLAVTGCFSESTGGSTLDPTPILTSVAILVPDSGLTKNIGSVPINLPTDVIIIVGNAGPYPATSFTASSGNSETVASGSVDLTAPYGFKGGSFPGEGGTCTGTVAAKTGCIIVMTVTPTAHGTFTEKLALSYFNGVITFSSTIEMTVSTTAELSLSVASVDITEAAPYAFGVKTVGAGADATITVTNKGGVAATALAETATLALAAPFSYRGGTFPGTGGDCPTDTTTELAVDGTCTLVVSFDPTIVGDYEDIISLDYNNGLVVTTTSAKFTGNTLAALTISEGSTWDFGLVGTGAAAATKLFTLSNSGGTAATFIAEKASAALVAPFAWTGASYPAAGTCTATLAAGATCTFTVQFDPSAAVVSTAIITLQYDNGLGSGTANVQATRPITGEGQ